MAGEAILTCTSVAPASFNSFTIRLEVVPLTIESSIMITLLPFTIDDTAESFILTPRSRISCVGWINVLPTYLFLISPIS